MVQSAPRFADVVHDIAVRLDGAVLVAHNIHFDLRMLRQEFDRIAAAEFDAGEGICTYRLTRKKLSVAAAEAGLGATSHTALGDARAAAAISAPPNDQLELLAGMRVCFTGTSTVDGEPMRRDVLEGLAENHWLVTVANVSRRCDVLVAADPLSQSGKANKARTYSIPIISTEDFLGALTQ